MAIELWKQHVGRRLAAGLSAVLVRQVAGHLEDEFLEPVALAIGAEVHMLNLSRTDERRSACVGRKPRFHLDFWRNLRRIQVKRCNLAPIDPDASLDSLCIALDARKPDLKMSLLGHRPDSPRLGRRASLLLSVAGFFLNGMILKGTPNTLATSSPNLSSSPTA